MTCMKLGLDILHSEHQPIYEQRDTENTLEGPTLIAYFCNAVLIDYI